MRTEKCDATKLTDHQLVEFAQAELPGCSDSFATLMKRYEPRVLGRCRRILGCNMAAQDAAQDVFLSILRSLPRYVPDRPFLHWVDVITSNACRQAIRKRSRDLAESEMQPEELAAEWVAPDPLLRTVLDRELARMTPETQVAIRLRFSEGLSFVAIADRQGLNVSTVKMRIKRAQAGLRRALPRLSTPPRSPGPQMISKSA